MESTRNQLENFIKTLPINGSSCSVCVCVLHRNLCGVVCCTSRVHTHKLNVVLHLQLRLLLLVFCVAQKCTVYCYCRQNVRRLKTLALHTASLLPLPIPAFQATHMHWTRSGPVDKIAGAGWFTECLAVVMLLSFQRMWVVLGLSILLDNTLWLSWRFFLVAWPFQALIQSLIFCTLHFCI